MYVPIQDVGRFAFMLIPGQEFTHTAFDGSPGVADISRLGWLFSDARDTLQAENTVKKHGTLMLSSVAGHDFGVAKLANIQVVKLGSPIKPADSIGGMLKACNDFLKKKADGTFKNAVMMMAWGIKPKYLNNLDRSDMQRILGRANSEGLMIVCAAGNIGNDPVSMTQLFLIYRPTDTSPIDQSLPGAAKG